MIYKAKKGQASYGEAIGIILLDTFSPYIPGDVANATTFKFPVRFQKINNLTAKRMFSKDKSALDQIIKAGEDLIEQGVKAITSNCGFMALFQREVSNKLEVPVFLTSLLQITFILKIIGFGNKVGIITSNSKVLDSNLLREIGVDDMSYINIKGMEDKEYFRKTVFDEIGWLDFEKVEKEVVDVAIDMVNEDPKVRAILLECSCYLPPAANAVQKAVNLPVFDFITMIDYVYSAVVKKKYEGFL